MFEKKDFPFLRKRYHAAFLDVSAHLEDVLLGSLEILQLPLIDRPIKARSCQQSIVQRPELTFYFAIVAPATVLADPLRTKSPDKVFAMGVTACHDHLSVPMRSQVYVA